MHPRRRDAGSAFVLTVLIAFALGAGAVVAVVPVARSLIDRQQAHSAADAAALAGVTGGRAASASVAAANGAVLVDWSQDGAEVTVTVQIGDHTISARATNGP
ncbi:MAG TPA: hypothetical protein VNQ73_03325 [Ilumatobacter sp.]|nr:hypothetical protein [Ilumatobacter sp.]